jgi:hypothetical protein
MVMLGIVPLARLYHLFPFFPSLHVPCGPVWPQYRSYRRRVAACARGLFVHALRFQLAFRPQIALFDRRKRRFTDLFVLVSGPFSQLERTRSSHFCVLTPNTVAVKWPFAAAVHRFTPVRARQPGRQCPAQTLSKLN